MSANKLVLVDGSYYLFRAYFALPNLTSDSGEPTGAIHGVISMLRKLRKDYPSAYFAVVFDSSGKTFRNELYAEYKANRPPAPEDLVAQIEPLHEIIRAQGVPILVIDNVEADDVIGTLATRACADGMETVISSGDKDLAQLVNDCVTVVNTMSNTTYDIDGVRDKYGVEPNQIIDYLALMGDGVDNIPGVPKVGPKTAAKWLQQYGTLEAVIKHADDIGGKVGENLRSVLEQLPLSQQLATVKCDVELDLKPRDLAPAPADNETLRRYFERFDLKTLLAELNRNTDNNPNADPAPETKNTVASTAESSTRPADNPAPAAEPAKAIERHYSIVTTDKDFSAWLNQLEDAELFAFDTETTSLEYMQAEIVGVSFAVRAGEAAYVPFAHSNDDVSSQLDRNTVLKQLKPLLENADRNKVGHNLKYDMSVLANHGIALAGIRHDTMLESYVLNSVESRHDMDSLASRYLNETTTKYEEVAGKGSKQVSFDQVPIEIAGPYAAEDADITLRLHQTLWPQLQSLPALQSLYETVELPLVGILSRMERNGVCVDADLLHTHSHELDEKMAQLEQHAHNLAGQSFNIGSPKQIQTILYDKMQIPVTAKTPKGQPSTAESVLEELAVNYELPRVILDYRALSKLKSTYSDKLPRLIDNNTGRVHTSYHQAVTATGRLSSSDPNLQNIPIRSPEGRRIRQAFIAPPGYTLLAADYSQIELRIMAHLSGDERLLQAFDAGEDIHRATAAEVFGSKRGGVTDEQRRAAKAINFGLIYGMSAWGLGRQLGIGRNDAQSYVDEYFRRYPGVKRFMDSTRVQAREQGYVETVFKRRLYLPDIQAKNAARRQYAERTAINAPMQGTAADIIKRAMIAIDAWLAEARLDIKMIMQVHDELVFEIAEADLDAARKAIVDLMQTAAELRVPLLVEAGHGQNWDEAH
ncbi:MAG: DNA polymerase I [Gammaproteobacteria bacterium]